MQDYYKILGVKEDASADEIRDRWVDLMREFHPDQSKVLEGEENQKRVKEINEAYQALKHSSTRLEYDLRKTYGQKKKRVAYAKIIIPLGIVLILIIAAVIYAIRLNTLNLGGPMPFRDPSPSSSESPSPRENSSPDNRAALSPTPGAPAKSGHAVLRDEKRETSDESPPAVRPETTRPEVTRNNGSGPSSQGETGNVAQVPPASRPFPGETGRGAQIEIASPTPGDAGQKTGHSEISSPVSPVSGDAEKPISPERARPVNKSEIGSLIPRDAGQKSGLSEISRPVAPVSGDAEKPTLTERARPMIQETAKLPPLSSPVIPPAVQTAPPPVLAPKSQELNVSGMTVAKSQNREAVIPKQEPAIVPPMPRKDQTAGTIETDAMFEKKWVVYHPSVSYLLVRTGGELGQSELKALMAEESEIKQFFLNYREMYVRKDATGFLRLFSARAVQNQKQGMEDIRRIYSTFFDQSQDLRYRAEEVVIEIYQNAVEAKAQYRVDQTLKKSGEKKVWTGPIRWVFVRENGLLKILSLDYQHMK